MKKFLSLLGLLALCAVAITSVASAGNDVTDAKNQYGKQGESKACGLQSNDTLAFYGSKKLWPPNHKYRTVTITATENDPMSNFTLDTTATSSEGDLANGSGHTLMDAAPPMSHQQGMTTTDPASLSQDIYLRAERAGGGTGRTYTITAKATFDNGASSCSQTYTITVPHDMRGGNR